MSPQANTTGAESAELLPAGQMDALLDALRGRGYAPVGPTVKDGAIVYGELGSANDLPIGLTDEQEGGRYRLRERGDQALFGYVVGPQSWKKYLYPPHRTLWRAKQGERGLEFLSESTPPPKLAFVGVRACELAAMGIQDRVFEQGPFAEPDYASRRRNVLIVAVQCVEAGNTCFCASMDTGPAVHGGADLILTELLGPGRHELLIRAGSAAGEALLRELPTSPASAEAQSRAEQAVAAAEHSMGRSLDTNGLPAVLMNNLEHPRWNEVAERCLSCANCTMVCPTCFCGTVEDSNDLLTGDAVRAWRWDSCFGQDYSYIHGGQVRASVRSRYRQWLTHKLATWHDQFGTSGCVGCGRCITWCPVGIDITEEAAALRKTVTEPSEADSAKRNA